MLGYLGAAFGGFMVGVILSCILLGKKNLEAAKKIESNITESVKQNIKTAKNVYKSAIDEYEDNNEVEEKVE